MKSLLLLLREIQRKFFSDAILVEALLGWGISLGSSLWSQTLATWEVGRLVLIQFKKVGERKRQKSMFYLEFPSGEELKNSISPFFIILSNFTSLSGSNIFTFLAVLVKQRQLWNLTVSISFMRADNLTLDISI